MVGFWYSAVNVKSEQSHRVKALLGSRDQLVRAKRALGNQVRGVLRPFGIRLLSRQGTKKFSTAAHQAVRHDAMFNANVTALLESAGGNRGSDCALGSATQGVGATLGRNFPGQTRNSGIPACLLPGDHQLHIENDTHRAIHVKRPLSFSIGQVEKRNCAAG
jgi:hypothetical protein